MTSLWRGAGLAIVLAGLTQVGAAAIESRQAPQPAKPAPAKVVTKVSKPAPRPSRAVAAPAFIRDRIDALGRAFDGRVGIAVKSIDDGWETGWKDDELYPQQSVSKLWVSITALDAVDKGKVSLDDKVTLTKSDLTLFHEPIIENIIDDGSYTTTLGDLMLRAITTSDNTANDKLMRSVGGPAAVRRMIAAKHLGAIRFYNGERALQSRIAGLIWSQDYALNGNFQKVRDALPHSIRRAAFNRYIEDPYDGAAPSAIVNALARLKRGELLSAQSTAHLLDVMSHTHTGPNRLKGGLQPGWSLNHKTGTGQELDGVQAGYNDVGILTAPDGKSYAVAVMIKKTSTPLMVRMTLMNDVVKAVIQQHDMRKDGRNGH
jgi:beta-lactamase class A